LFSEDEISILIERAHKRLEAAELLFKQGFYEDTISRAYYSMFYAARALLLREDITVKTHRGLISQFGLKFVEHGPLERQYGRSLRITEELREESEYSISRKISPKEAEAVLKDAKEFLIRIKELLEEPESN
jgi:uncharacterized protein (UPF0332 family)